MKEVYKYVSIFSIIVIVIALIFPAITNMGGEKEKNEYYLKVLKKDTCWIYEIAKNDKVLIRQEYIPAIRGKQVFKSKKDAEIIGKLVLNKLYRNQIPRLTIDEVTANNITFNNL